MPVAQGQQGQGPSRVTQNWRKTALGATRKLFLAERSDGGTWSDGAVLWGPGQARPEDSLTDGHPSPGSTALASRA